MSNGLIENMPDEVLSRLWIKYDWKNAEKELFLLQQELSKAAKNGSDNICTAIQKQIVNSQSACMLAVRKACSTDPIPGTDKVSWKTPAEKCRAALSLNKGTYHAHPYRHIRMETKNGRERYFNMPTYTDRTMQILYSYTIDPIEEATGDRKSFAFRRGRSAQDATEYVRDAIANPDIYYVISADVKSYYQSISHEWLLNNIPMDRHVLKEFLKAGYLFNGEIFPTDDFGISLGNNISPILGNMVLDGMQQHIFRSLYGYTKPDYANGNLIRYADDIIITAKTENDAIKILGFLADFLAERGLRLSEEKTKIIHVSEGFDFISHHFVRKNGVVSVTPSDHAVEHIKNELQDLILTHKGSQKNLIDKINKKLMGWATYHKTTDAMSDFRNVDTFVKATLLRLCEIKHPKWSIGKIKQKYWYLDYDGEYVYALKDKTDVRVMKLTDVSVVEHKKVKTNVNGYLDTEYIENRAVEREIDNVTGKYKAIWKRQNGKCYYCGKHILVDQPRTVIQINPTRGRKINNLAYIHQQCQCSRVEFVQTDTTPVTESDLMSLIRSLDRDDKIKKPSKFTLLSDYFAKCVKPTVSLTFKDIEKIMGEPLCKSAYNVPQYWYKTGDDRISGTWLMHGYELQRLHLKERKIILRRTGKHGDILDIPDVFLTNRIPADAKCELENFFDYIRKKYGI